MATKTTSTRKTSPRKPKAKVGSTKKAAASKPKAKVGSTKKAAASKPKAKVGSTRKKVTLTEIKKKNPAFAERTKKASSRKLVTNGCTGGQAVVEKVAGKYRVTPVGKTGRLGIPRTVSSIKSVREKVCNTRIKF